MSMKEVAKIAGVSPSTVSRIINDKGNKCAGEEVQMRVWAAIRETGYIPNQSAKLLKEGISSSTEAPTISCLFARNADPHENSYFLQLSIFVEQEILRNECKVGKQYHGAEVGTMNPNDLHIGKNDGLVVLGKTEHNQSNFLSFYNKRVVHITLHQMELEEDHIMCDGKQATELAVSYLYENGHKSIAYVGEDDHEIRYLGYRSFLKQMNIPFQMEYVFKTPITIAGGYKAVQKLLLCKNKPTAAFCANDATAIGFLKGLKENGLSIPEDISVISIDNITEADLTSPALTTVKVPLKDMGSFAVKTLIDRIHKGHKVNLNIFMPSELIVRGSVRQI